MCIVIWTTACASHGIPLILLSNRDEFLHRPTQKAEAWDSNGNVIYSGRDLARPEHGTWLGINKRGRFAALTNVREATSVGAFGSISRGAVVSSFLTPLDSKFEKWMKSLDCNGDSIPALDIDQVGGFSMLCGQITRKSEQEIQIGNLAVISNRGGNPEREHIKKIDSIDPTASDVYGLSNSPFTKPWPKVLLGQQLLNELAGNVCKGAIKEQDIVEEGLKILSHDCISIDTEWDRPEGKIGLLEKSIFIPSFDTENVLKLNPEPRGPPREKNLAPQTPDLWSDISSLYGTQKQSVIIIYASGRVRYVEKTLFDWQSGGVPSEPSMVDISFDLEI